MIEVSPIAVGVVKTEMNREREDSITGREMKYRAKAMRRGRRISSMRKNGKTRNNYAIQLFNQSNLWLQERGKVDEPKRNTEGQLLETNLCGMETRVLLGDDHQEDDRLCFWSF